MHQKIWFFTIFLSCSYSFRSFMFCRPLQKKGASIYSHKCVNGETLIISLTGKMHVNTIENYRFFIRHYFLLIFLHKPLLSLFLCNLYVGLCLYVCVHVNLTDLTIIEHSWDTVVTLHFSCQWCTNESTHACLSTAKGRGKIYRHAF